jgi:hypothetical protein
MWKSEDHYLLLDHHPNLSSLRWWSLAVEFVKASHKGGVVREEHSPGYSQQVRKAACEDWR